MAKIGTLRPFVKGKEVTEQLNKVMRDFYDALNKDLNFDDNFKSSKINVQAKNEEEFSFLHGLRETPISI